MEQKNDLENLAVEASEKLNKKPESVVQTPKIHIVELPVESEIKLDSKEVKIKKRKRKKEGEKNENIACRKRNRIAKISRRRKYREKSFFSKFFDW